MIKLITAFKHLNSAEQGMSDLVFIAKQTLTASQYSDLADVPPELEWLANITNAKTRRFYKSDVAEFFIFTGRLYQEVADWLYYLIKEREDSNRLFQTFPSG